MDSLCRPVSQGLATAGDACPLCTLVCFEPCEMAAIAQLQETEKSQGTSFSFHICYVARHNPLLPVLCLTMGFRTLWAVLRSGFIPVLLRTWQH